MKPDSTVYTGEIFDGEALVLVDGEYLDHRPSCALANHSPSGFGWGYAGSGPAQLALALLFDFYGDAHIALHFYQLFKERAVVELDPHAPWRIEGSSIRQVIDELKGAQSQ